MYLDYFCFKFCTVYSTLGYCLDRFSLIFHKKYNFLGCDSLIKLLFSNNSLVTEVVIGQLVIEQFDKPITFKTVVEINQSHSKLQFKSNNAITTLVTFLLCQSIFNVYCPFFVTWLFILGEFDRLSITFENFTNCSSVWNIKSPLLLLLNISKKYHAQANLKRHSRVCILLPKYTYRSTRARVIAQLFYKIKRALFASCYRTRFVQGHLQLST